jgi:putative tricarboxylic transport membrane protein
LAELRRYPAVTAISGVYGTIMGIIPGVGEFVAQFFSYATARSMSKKPEQFGHGSPEGLIASETANNAVPAAAMIPLLALGVPGEALTAMMMVVFFDAGVKPGPDIFEKSPDFLFSLFIALLIINVLVVIALLFSTRLIARMIFIPNRFLGVFIMIFAFVGVFSIRNNFFDCVVAALFGFIGYILRRLQWPLVPVVLGMVLGSIMVERPHRWRQSYQDVDRSCRSARIGHAGGGYPCGDRRGDGFHGSGLSKEKPMMQDRPIRERVTTLPTSLIRRRFP